MEVGGPLTVINYLAGIINRTALRDPHFEGAGVQCVAVRRPHMSTRNRECQLPSECGAFGPAGARFPVVVVSMLRADREFTALRESRLVSPRRSAFASGYSSPFDGV